MVASGRGLSADAGRPVRPRRSSTHTSLPGPLNLGREGRTVHPEATTGRISMAERDTNRPDPDDLPDGSGTDTEGPDDGKDTASGGGADDR